MDAFVKGLAASLVGLAVGLPIGLVFLLVRRRLNRANLPGPAQRSGLLSQLQAMKREGRSFSDRVEFLQTQGLRRDVAAGLITDSERKEKADIDSPASAQRLGYSFRYPRNWRLQSSEQLASPNRFFRVKSLSSAMITISLTDGVASAAVDLDQLKAKATAKFSNVKTRPLAQWGRFNGRGVVYSAETQGHPVFGKIFHWQEHERGFHVVTVCLDEDREDAEPGLALIESSFATNIGNGA